MTGITAKDKGLQAERTALSWQRTALSTAAITALSLRQAAELGWGAASIPAVFASITMFVASAMCLARVRVLRSGHAGVSPFLAALFSALVVLSAVAAGSVDIR